MFWICVAFFLGCLLGSVSMAFIIGAHRGDEDRKDVGK